MWQYNTKVQEAIQMGIPLNWEKCLREPLKAIDLRCPDILLSNGDSKIVNPFSAPKNPEDCGQVILSTIAKIFEIQNEKYGSMGNWKGSAGSETLSGAAMQAIVKKPLRR